MNENAIKTMSAVEFVAKKKKMRKNSKDKFKIVKRHTFLSPIKFSEKSDLKSQQLLVLLTCDKTVNGTSTMTC